MGQHLTSTTRHTLRCYRRNPTGPRQWMNPSLENTRAPPSSEISTLMKEVLHKENLRQALERVKRNKGAPGIDGMSVDELGAHLKANWPSIRAQLVAGTYQPKPVKRVEIPKPDGRKRLLGIPTVVDRFIQQAIAQIVQRQWEPHFHPHSYGFRPGRNAHQAMRHAQATIRQGHGWVVDIVQELKTALNGWKAYFGIAEVLSPLREIDKWVRRRLRCYVWKQWGSAGYRELRKRGVSVREAWNTSKSAHGPWRLSKTPAMSLALPAKLFRQMGLPELAPMPRRAA